MVPPPVQMQNEVVLSNGEIDVAVARGFGPRVLAYGFRGSDNMFGSASGDFTTTKYGTWHPVGGHRLWTAPESDESYAPDNNPVDCEVHGARSVSATQKANVAGMCKQLHITLDQSGTGVTVVHRITNIGSAPVELAPWALTILRAGGVAILPQEPYRPHTEEKLPARSLSLWGYTDLSDPRWRIGARFIRLTPDASHASPQKLGVLNKQRWCAYYAGDELFIKLFPYNAHTAYPDYGCNNEVFTAGSFVELESLGPMVRLGRGDGVEHVERWHLHRGVDLGTTEESIERVLTPLVMAAERRVD
ncbi:MAG TPA: hypothetical protein VE967_05200 [Gemmatimonadaceae bacterium]|nr:hypothetical protein [Gemmatimonadaceae bacterium]